MCRTEQSDSYETVVDTVLPINDPVNTMINSPSSAIEATPRELRALGHRLDKA